MGLKYYLYYIFLPWVLYGRAVKLLNSYLEATRAVKLGRVIGNMGTSRLRFLVVEEALSYKIVELVERERRAGGARAEQASNVIQFRDPTKLTDVKGGK
jgi:hypothetical protein